MKDHVFRNNPHMVEEVKAEITTVGVRITEENLVAVI
jgi:hypothetical protein